MLKKTDLKIRIKLLKFLEDLKDQRNFKLKEIWGPSGLMFPVLTADFSWRARVSRTAASDSSGKSSPCSVLRGIYTVLNHLVYFLCRKEWMWVYFVKNFLEPMFHDPLFSWNPMKEISIFLCEGASASDWSHIVLMRTKAKCSKMTCLQLQSMFKE